MGQSYLKNAALLTGADVLLRLAGMGLRIYLANALGGEGMGLYQLVLAVYALFVTLATAGVSVAATRLMAEELARGRAQARGMLVRLAGTGLLLGAAAMAAQYGLAGAAARWWLGDVRAAGALRVSAFGMPWMALSAVLRGFFIARRRVEPNVLSQLVEQSVRIGIIWYALEWGNAPDVSARCTAVLAATAVSEAVSACILLLFYRGEAVRAFGAEKARRPADPARRLWEILWPVEGGRCLASALHTAENMLVPACLTVCLLDAGGRSAAVAQYGSLKGMALPLLTFPFGLLGSLSVLLMPEITQAHIRGERARLDCLLDRMLRLTGCFSALAGALFWVWGEPLALLLYHSQEAGFYLRVLGPAMPLMYLESMVDGAMKGMGEQKAVFRYSLWDAVLRIAGVLLLLPRWGMKGFLWVILLSSAYTCQMNTARLLHVSGLKPRLWRWLGAPALAALVSAGAGQREHAHPAGGALCGRLWHGGSLPCRAVAAGAGRRGAGHPADRKIPQGAAEKPGESELFWTQGGELSIIQWILWRNRRMGLWTLWPATPGKTGADRSRPDAKEDFCEENKEACAAGVAAPDGPGAAGRGHRDIQLLLCPAAPGRRRGGGQLVAPQPCPALPESALDRGALPAQLSGGRAVPCALEVCRGA